MVSLIAGLVGLVFATVFFCLLGIYSAAFAAIGGIIGLVCGFMAKSEIANSHGTIGGAGLATAGVIVGLVNVAIAVLSVLLLILLLFGIIGLGLLSGISGSGY
jgi:uncharacterized membrane protein